VENVWDCVKEHDNQTEVACSVSEFPIVTRADACR